MKFFKVILTASLLMASNISSAGKTEYFAPNEKQLWKRFDERRAALVNNHFESWLNMAPPGLVDEVGAEDPDALRAMFEFYSTQFSALKVLEICDCGEMTSPQGNPAVRCRTVTRMEPAGSGEAFKVLEMWHYESGQWHWGYTDHHPLDSCPDR